MRLLLDTHTFLWFVEGHDALSDSAAALIEDLRHEKFLSVASLWEMAIKVGLGKLTLSVPLAQVIQRGALENGIALLDVRPEHALGVADLPRHHRDPFDRLLVVQAMVEDMTVVGRDEAFDAYPVARAW